MDTEYVLARFGRSKGAGRRGYRRFVEEGMGMGRVPELTGGGLIRSLGGWSKVISVRRKGEGEESDERILGDGDFVQRILGEVEDKQLCQLKVRRRGVTIGDIIQEECRKAGVNPGELRNGGRRRLVTAVRVVVAHRCAGEIGLTAADIARQLGLTTSSITRAIARLDEQKGK